MFIEVLEARIAPAAVVALTTTAGALKIQVPFVVNGPLVSLEIDPNPSGGVDITNTDGLGDVTYTLNGKPLTADGNDHVYLPSALGSITVNDVNNVVFGSGSFEGGLNVALSPYGGVVDFDQTMTGGGITVSVYAPTGQGPLVKELTGSAGSSGFAVNFNGASMDISGPVKIALIGEQNSVSIFSSSFAVSGGFTFSANSTPGISADVGSVGVGQSYFLAEPSGAGSGPSTFVIEGGLAFSSNYAESQFQLDYDEVTVGGSVSIQENLPGRSVPSPLQPGDVFQGNIAVNVGGAFSWSMATPQSLINLYGNNAFGQLLVDAGENLNIAGKISTTGNGFGEIQIDSGGSIQLGAVSSSFSEQIFSIDGFNENNLAYCPVAINGGGLLSHAYGASILGSTLAINGSISISTVGINGGTGGFVGIAGSGYVAGGISVSNPQSLEINDPVNFNGIIDVNPNAVLDVAGAISVTESKTNVSVGGPAHIIELINVQVDGGLSVTGNRQGDTVSLQDTRIFGSASFNLGAGVQTIAITQVEFGAPMFIAGSIMANLSGAGDSFTISDQSVPDSAPAFMVLGAVSITAPFASTDTFSFADTDGNPIATSALFPTGYKISN